jgi:hypothetical protein
MQRRKRFELVQVGENLGRNDRGAAVLDAAMDDTMADPENAGAAVLRSEPARQAVQRCAVIPDFGIRFLIDQNGPVTMSHDNARRGPNTLDLTS